METLIRGSDFAKSIGVANVATHLGFITKNPRDLDYDGVLQVVKHVAGH